MRRLLVLASLSMAACTSHRPASAVGDGGLALDGSVAPPPAEDLAVADLASADALPPSVDDLAVSGPSARDQILALLEKVADWQIAQYGTQNPETWIDGTFYAGLMAAHAATQQPRFADRATVWAQANKWSMGGDQSPDWQCAGQTFLELYQGDQVAAHLAPTRQVLDGVVKAAQPGRKVWWWADALFMAPPVFARLGAATAQDTYFTTMSTMWWDVTSALYDSSAGLFFRDASYLTKTCPNGQKMFWSRGNGWVMAGLVRVLEYLPASHPDRKKFVAQLQALAGRVAALQKADGYWPSCLTDAADYGEPETSGTAAFVFALAHGVNDGTLDGAQYLPVIRRGWTALVGAVDASGKLGWVQPVGAAPGVSNQGDTQPYGVGLFLLAGSQVAKLADRL